MNKQETFYEYVQISRPGRQPVIKTRIKFTSGQLLRFMAFKEEERQVGPRIKEDSSTALKMKINYRKA